MSTNTSYEKRIEMLKEIIGNSNKIVFFGGAGVSTSSGIPDFRSANGLYNNVSEEFAGHAPEYYLDTECFNHNPKMFYKFYRKFMDARNYEPNVVHKSLAKLEQDGKMLGIVTQNIDMLHEKAGSEKVFKIHGTIGENHCIQCGEYYDIDTIFDNKDAIPRCTNCNGSNNFIKPDVVLYGEMLPYDAKCKAYDALVDADCLIVAGTSLTVEPAASMIYWFTSSKHRKISKMVILNRDATAYDRDADLIFHEDMNMVFKDLELI